ncbi:OmpA family protein [Flavobacteriaceae bacterium M23B6Z8]
MTKRTSYLLGIALTIIIGMFLNWFLCCSTTESVTETPPKIVEETETVVTRNPLEIKTTEGELIADAAYNFNFNFSGFPIINPVEKDVEIGIEKLQQYMQKNPNYDIDITGYYSDKETNNSAFPNLGIARATSIKNYLVTKGIPSSVLNTKGELKDDLLQNGNTIIGPLSITLAEKNVEETSNLEEKLEAMAKQIKADPLILYFNTGASEINLNESQRSKIALISSYLDKKEGAICIVTGHTDDTGNRQKNIELGQQRADFIKIYLVNNGIPESKINANSEGPDAPIASNITEEGRAKNRRTEVTIN